MIMAEGYPSTVKEFRARFPDYAQHTIHNLEDEGYESGSNWKVAHLEACRILFKSCVVVPALKRHTDAARKMVNISDSSHALIDLKKLSADQISKMCHKQLRAAGGSFGSFYVALADVMRPPSTSTSLRSSTRVRRPANQSSEYVTGQGLSSPPKRATSQEPSSPSKGESPSSSPFQPSSQDEGEFETQLHRAKREAVCANLAAEFISSVLDWFLAGPEHNPKKCSRIEFSREPTIFKLHSSALYCTCIDDGSIIWCQPEDKTFEWTSGKKFLCSLEAKAKYSKANAMSGVPIISDRVHAQLACELIGAMMALVDKTGTPEPLAGLQGVSSNGHYQLVLSCFPMAFYYSNISTLRHFLISIHQQNMVFL
jgi:hypothetical protein